MPASAGSLVADFVRALALAWKNLAAYPAGHPALEGALETAVRKLDELRGPAGEVTFGIAAGGLVYGREKVETEHAQKFGYALYAAGVALLRFDFETDAQALGKFLRVVGVGAARERRAPLWDELWEAGVSAIHLTAVDYSGVQVTDTLDRATHEAHRGSLWDEILEALLAGKIVGAQSGTHAPKSIDELSALIVETIDEARAFDTQLDSDATFGVKLTARVPPTTDTPAAIEHRLGDTLRLYLAGSSGSRRQVAAQQATQLLRSLPEPLRTTMLRSMLEALAHDETAGSLMAEVTSAFSRDHVLEALTHLDASQFASHAMLLLRSIAGESSGAGAPAAGGSPIDKELVTLFGDDDVDRFNPPDHQALLEEVALHTPKLPRVPLGVEALGDRVESVRDDQIDTQLAETTFDLLERYGDTRPSAPLFARVESIFRAQAAAARFGDALATLERLRALAEPARAARLREGAAESITRLADPEVIRGLIASAGKTEHTDDLRRVVELLGAAATHALLVALTEEENRSRRRRLYDLALSLGAVIVPEARRFLTDDRWFVVRNMIVLLRVVKDRTSLGDIRRLADHPDLRVRLEAIKTLLMFDSSVPRTLLARAIQDPDPKLAETAISLVASYQIKEGVEPLLQIVNAKDYFGAQTQLRIRAIRALGELAEPRALDHMPQFFSDSFLPWPPRDERRVAFESLASYPADARKTLIERGLRSRDPVVRELCQKMVGE
jgi:hypothetical protein